MSEISDILFYFMGIAYWTHTIKSSLAHEAFLLDSKRMREYMNYICNPFEVSKMIPIFAV